MDRESLSICVNVVESRALPGEDRKAGAEPEAGNAMEALRQAATGHRTELGISGIKRSVTSEEETIVFEDTI